MDNDIMEKINEVLKAHGKHELSLDDLEQVAGGKGDGVINGVQFSEAEFNDLWISMAKSCGYEVAVQMLMTMTGYQPPQEGPLHVWGGETDEEKMSAVLYTYWTDRY